MLRDFLVASIGKFCTIGFAQQDIIAVSGDILAQQETTAVSGDTLLHCGTVTMSLYISG